MVEAEKKAVLTSTVSCMKVLKVYLLLLKHRGNIYNDFAGAAAPGSGALGDFDAILKQLD